MRWVGLLFALLLSALPAHADSLVVQSCGTLPQAYPAGSTRNDVVDVNGNKCATGSVTATLSPSSSSSVGITGVVSSTAESSHVLKGASGNLYSIYLTTGATAGYLMVFNATSAPSNGAVTPDQCIEAPANSTVGISNGIGPPDVYSTGITAVFSSTGCFTQTLSATAMFRGRVE